MRLPALLLAALLSLSAGARAQCEWGDASFEAGCERSSSQAADRMRALSENAAPEPGEDFRCWWGSGSFEEGCGPARALPCDEMPPVAALLSAAPGEPSSPRFDPVSLAILQSLILSLAYAQ